MFDLTTLKKDDLKNALANATQKTVENAGNPMLLFKARLGQDGWIVGAEALPVTGKTVVLLSASITKGWVAFEDKTNKKLGDNAVSIWSHEKASAAEFQGLPNAKVNAQTSALVMIPELNLQAEMKGSTVGMESAFNNLIPRIVKRLEDGHRVYVNPKLRLDTDTYKHKEYGLTYTPELLFLGWCNDKGETEGETKQVAADIV